MNTFFQVITIIIITIVVFWLLTGAQLFTEITTELFTNLQQITKNKDKNKSYDSCNYLTMTECLNKPECQYITNSKDFRLNGCYNINKVAKGFRTYQDDDYTRARIANDNDYRNTKVSIFN